MKPNTVKDKEPKHILIPKAPKTISKIVFVIPGLVCPKCGHSMNYNQEERSFFCTNFVCRHIRYMNACTEEIYSDMYSYVKVDNKKLHTGNTYRRIDMTGKEYGDFEVIEYSHTKKYKTGSKAYWKCKCKKCGEISVKAADSIKKGFGCMACYKKSIAR